MTDTPLWLVRHVEKELGTRFLNAAEVKRGAFRKGWLVNTSHGAVVVSRPAAGEPHVEKLPLPDSRRSMTCTVCDWHMAFVGVEFPVRAYCSNCGTLHELWHDGNLRRLSEPQAVMPREVVADAAPVAKAKPRSKATKAAPKAAPKAAKKPAAKKAPSKPAKTAGYVDFKGDVDPIIVVEGIGPTYAKRLEAAGIKTTARLCYETVESIAKTSGAPAKTVTAWQSHAQLMKVSGIGGQYAEALVRGGISGIDELKRKSAPAIAAQVNKYLDTLEVNVLGQKVTAKRIEGFKRAAAKMRRVKQAIPQE